MSRVLVTGGHGFLGTHLVRHLLESGDAVRCLYRRPGRPASLAGLDVEIAPGDVRHRDRLDAALRGVDEVYHLAGLTSSLTRRAMLRTNTTGTANLLDAAERAGVAGRFVYCSSLAASGPSAAGEPLAEEAPCRPVTWYGESKLRAEMLVLERGGRLPVTVLRPPAVYGPHDLAFLPIFRAAARRIALVPGRSQKRYSMVHAADLALAFRLAARSVATAGRVYFAAHPETITLAELIATAEGAVGRRAVRLRLPESLLRLCGEVTDLVSQITGRSSVLGSQRMLELSTGHWVCSPAALERATGWRARLDLAQGFRETVAWYREQCLLP